MASIYKCCHGKTIRPGRSWVDKDGTRHPSNWHIWSAGEKEARGITEIVQESHPDSRLYTWSYNADGTVNSTPKSLDDFGMLGEDELRNVVPILDEDGNERMFPGVKSTLKEEVNNQQGSLLDQTDWYIIRKADKATAIPSNVQTWRDAIRTKGDAMKSAIDGAANTAAIEALFVVYDADGNKSGILYDWPVLGE
jgi:hypothetical protein